MVTWTLTRRRARFWRSRKMLPERKGSCDVATEKKNSLPRTVVEGKMEEKEK